MQAYIGQIIIFSGDFAIREFAKCAGQLMAISQNTALFSLIGTAYGGDGKATFGLPELRGRTPIGIGRGPGLPKYDLGEQTGSTFKTLNSAEMATHTHSASITGLAVSGAVNVTQSAADANDPNGAYLATSAGPHKIYSQTREPDDTSTLAADALTLGIVGGEVNVRQAGAGRAFSLMQPSLAVNYLIALQGLYPSRS